MKRTPYLLYLVLFLNVCFASCKKDKGEPDYDLSGTTWRGSLDVGNYVHPDFTLKFNPNGGLEVSITGVNTWTGTWNKPAGSQRVNVTWQEDANTWQGGGDLNGSNTEIPNGIVDRSPATYSATFEVTRE